MKTYSAIAMRLDENIQAAEELKKEIENSIIPNTAKLRQLGDLQLDSIRCCAEGFRLLGVQNG